MKNLCKCKKNINNSVSPKNINNNADIENNLTEKKAPIHNKKNKFKSKVNKVMNIQHINDNVNNKKKVLTPKKKMILGYDENDVKNEWYQDTFKNELHILNSNNNDAPPPPFSVPKLNNVPNINMKIKEHNNINKHRNIFFNHSSCNCFCFIHFRPSISR